MKPLNKHLQVRVDSMNNESVTEGGIIIQHQGKRDEFAMVWKGVLEDCSGDCSQRTLWELNKGNVVFFDKRAAKEIPGVADKDKSVYFISEDNVYAITDAGVTS